MVENPKGPLTQLGSGLIRKHKTRLEKLDRDRLYSLLRIFTNYERISFTTFTPGANTIKHLRS
jgi:hypothetical protein